MVFLIQQTMLYAVPLMIVALAGVCAERSGVINLALEGIMIFGAFIGCFVGAFLILVQNPIQAFWFVVLFLCIQQIEGNLVYPKVVGNSVGLPSIWVLVAVTVGGSTMGVAGMLVMIPLASVLYSLLRTATRDKLREKGVEKQKYTGEPPQLKKKV